MHIITRKECNQEEFCDLCEWLQDLRYHKKQLVNSAFYQHWKKHIDNMVAECPANVIAVEQMVEKSGWK